MTAREFFEDARRCSARIEELQFEMAEPAPRGRSRGAVRAPGTSDPTASMAERAIDGAAAMAREMLQCQRCVSEALAVIDGVRAAFETPWWRVLELYYIDRMGWAEVADEMGLSKRTCIRWRDAALQWVDFVGMAHAKRGEGRAV